MQSSKTGNRSTSDQISEISGRTSLSQRYISIRDHSPMESDTFGEPRRGKKSIISWKKMEKSVHLRSSGEKNDENILYHSKKGIQNLGKYSWIGKHFSKFSQGILYRAICWELGSREISWSMQNHSTRSNDSRKWTMDDKTWCILIQYNIQEYPLTIYGEGVFFEIPRVWWFHLLGFASMWPIFL